MASHPKLTLTYGNSLTNPTEFRMVVGSLQYLTFTRPDISYAVSKLSQFMQKPTDDHWQTAKWVLCYMDGTVSHGILIHKKSPLLLHAYSDANLAGNPDDYVSTSTYIICLGATPISWSAKKQTWVDRSNTEAECPAVANTISEIWWVCSLLSELGIVLPNAHVIYCDNVGSTYLCVNPIFHSRMIHVDL